LLGPCLALGACHFDAIPLAGAGSDSSRPADAASPDGLTSADASGPDASAPDAWAVEVRVNVNGSELPGLDYPGLWAADPGDGGVCGGLEWTVTGPIDNTRDDPLFQSLMYAYDVIRCRVGAGLPAGTYRVGLYFAEVYFGAGCPGGFGRCVFDVALEGATVYPGLDLLAEGEGCAMSDISDSGHPVVKTFTIRIDDGALDVGLSPAGGSGCAEISAIDVVAPP